MGWVVASRVELLPQSWGGCLWDGWLPHGRAGLLTQGLGSSLALGPGIRRKGWLVAYLEGWVVDICNA